VTLYGDLLVQARMLATRDPRRPKQANLRRSVSTTYYALFHLLAEDAAAVVAGGGAARAFHRQLVAGRLEHATMYRVSQAVAEVRDWVQASGLHIPVGLGVVAEVFGALQDERRLADYDSSDRFTRARAIEALERAEFAFQAWQAVRRSDAARLYLLAMLLGPPRRR
jgi:hypothetical protein